MTAAASPKIQGMAPYAEDARREAAASAGQCNAQETARRTQEHERQEGGP